MVEMDTLAGKVFALLKGNGLQIKIFDEEGAETTDPTVGRRFFVASPNIMVTIDEDNNTIQFSKGASVDSSIDKLQKNIRKIADEFLMNSDIKVFGKQIQPRDYAYQAKMKKGNNMNTLAESLSRMFGSARTSQQTLENVRILVKHKTPVDENVRGSRTRHISAIFLESNGERFRFPHNYLPGARAMAQHMAHGGTFGDKVGSYISESTGNLLKLQSFNRYVTTNKLINEDSSGIVETVKENIETIRTELKKLTGVKTYETVKARLETFEREALAEDDTSTLKDLFTIRRFDEKFEGVLPIIKQLVQEKDTFHKRIEEAAAGVVMVRRESLNTTPMFEFSSENARLGFKLNELALRIMENDELSGFVNKVGTKLCREGQVNDFEKAVLTQVLENLQIAESSSVVKKDIKESTDLTAYFDRYDYMFMSQPLTEAKYNVTFHLKPNGVETMTGIEASSSDEAIKKAKASWKPSRGFTAKRITAKVV